MASRNTYEEKIRLGIEASGDKELAQLAGQLNKLASGSDSAAEQAQQLVAELEKLASTSQNIKQFTTLKASITETATALEKAKEKLAGLGAEVDRTENPTRKLQASLKRAADEVENLSKQQNRQQAELQRTNGALRAAGVDTEKLATAYEDLQGEFSGFSDRAGDAAAAMQKTAKQGKAAAGGVSALDKAAGASKKSLGEIAAQLTIVSGAATAALKGLALLSGAALFKGGIQSATTLEQALSEVQAVAGATAEEMEQLKAAAEAGGASTKFSTLEAAQGLGELARATGNARLAIESLPATLNLAQAAGLGVAQAAEYITTTLTQYGLAADQASRVSDILAQTANTTTADVTGLGNALSYAAPLAKLLGLDVERTAAVIGAMADQGFRGERAGTALRNVFSEMLDPASDFAKALRDLGIESSDFVEVIEQLGTKGKRGQDALLKLDAAARPAILSLVNSGSKALRQLDGDLRNAAGSAEETAKIMGDNLSGAAEQIKDTFDRTRRSLVEPLLEPLRDELFFLADQLEEFAASPEFEEIKQALAGMFADGAEAARDLIQNVDFAELAQNIRTALSNAGETITEFKENLGTILETLQLIGNGFSLVFNSIQAAVLLIAGALAKLAAVGAAIADSFTAPARAFLEFIGVIKEGEYDLSRVAGGLNAVGDEFGSRFVDNALEAAEAAKALAAAGSDAGTATAEGMAQAGAASDALGESVARLEPVVVRATEALDAQAAGAADAADSTAAAAGKMELSAERLQKAFADMGLASQVDLQRAAESAKANFELIRQAVSAGEATAEDARRAFAKYAEAARAAVADSNASARDRVEAELKVTEAVVNVGVALDDMGERGRAAGEGVSSGAERARQSLTGLGGAASNASRAVVDVARSAEQAGAASRQAADDIDGMAFSLGAASQAFYDAATALNQYAGTRTWTRGMNQLSAELRRQNALVDQLNAGYDEQLSKLDPLAEKLAALRQQYKLVDEAALRQLAEKEKQLEDRAQAAAAEQARLAQERARAAQDAAAAAQTPAEPARANTGRVGAGAAGVVGSFGTIRVELPSGQSGEILTDADGAELVRALIEELTRSQAVTVRRRIR